MTSTATLASSPSKVAMVKDNEEGVIATLTQAVGDLKSPSSAVDKRMNDYTTDGLRYIFADLISHIIYTLFLLPSESWNIPIPS